MTCFQCRFFMPESYSVNWRKMPCKCELGLDEEFKSFGKNCERFEYEPGTWRES